MLKTLSLSAPLTVLLIWITTPPFLLARSKVDVIHLSNGDTITGEIKQLERGILTVSTDFMGTIGIEWRGVLRVTSPQTFDVDTGTSARFEGSFPESGQDGVINVSRAPQDVQILERIDIVRIRSLDKNFWDRLDARVDFGLSVTRANRIATYNLSSEASYEMQGATTQVTYSSFLTSQQDLETLARNQLGVSHERRFRERWFGIGLGQFQQNEELGLQLRSLGGGGVGRYLKQTNNWILKVTGGMGVMRERFDDADSAQVNVEGLTALNLDFFRFEGNKQDISANVYFWPSLTDFGRVRLDFDATLRYKIFKDFTWGFSFWNNFDSQPATDAGKNDFGLSSTIGYKF